MTGGDEVRRAVDERSQEDEENVCYCGHRYGIVIDDEGREEGVAAASSAAAAAGGGGAATGRRQQQPRTGAASSPVLDASFVHLPSSETYREEDGVIGRRKLADGRTIPPAGGVAQNKPLQGNDAQFAGAAAASGGGFLEGYRHLQRLERAAAWTPSLDDDEDPLRPGAPPPRLCLRCLTRVENALDSDADRIEGEIRTYQEAMREERAKSDAWKRAVEVIIADTSTVDISTAAGSGGRIDDEAFEAAVRRTEQEFRNEIEILKEACAQQEAEVLHLLALQREQALVLKELDELDRAAEEEWNTLELEARAFDNEQEQLYRASAQVQDEVRRLSSPEVTQPPHKLLFRLQVDQERGLRYPLINNLRLAYRPKGDVHWDEIQAAWALAAQLVLSISALLDFQSVHWKVVPLSHCAKLIFCPPSATSGDRSGGDHSKTTLGKPVVYNLGHPRTDNFKALLAWNALLHQMIHHTTIKLHDAVEAGLFEATEIPSLPFEITATKIGALVLSQLKPGDDSGWSKAIHCMSSNLLWLSDCTSLYVRQKILLKAAAAVS